MHRRTLFRTLIALCALATAAGATAAVVEMGEPAPPLRGTLVSGETFDLADYRGKVVLVNFFSSYCKGCAYEIGAIETFRDDYRDRGFDVLVIGVDRPVDKARVARMLGTYNLQGAMASDLDESGFERSYPTPTAFVVDRDGVVREKLWGAKTLPRLRELLSPYLNLK
jgi:peroxiredoxin